MMLCLSACRRPLDAQVENQKSWASVRYDVVPARVPFSYVRYRNMLDYIGETDDTTGTITTQMVLDAIPDTMMRECGSPLLADAPWGAQNKVFLLGTNLVSLAFATQTGASNETSLIVERLLWLVKGLRQEPGISCRYSACVIEQSLVSMLWDKQSSNISDNRDLYDRLVRDELRSTCYFLIDFLSDFRSEKLSGSERQLFSDVHEFLQRLLLEPCDYRSSQSDCLRLVARMGEFDRSRWAHDMKELFSGLLQNEILLQMKKKKFRTEAGEE
jgi:hypothetical protein